MKNYAGFSLVELLITIAIMITLISISAISFNTWTRKSNIEKQTRELYADISEARTNAFTQKIVYGIVFQPTSYVIKTYASEAEYITNVAAATATNGVVVATKNLGNSISMSGSDISNRSVVFDTTGFSASWFLGLTIFVGSTTEQAALNCVVISTARANMGKINGTNCDFR